MHMFFSVLLFSVEMGFHCFIMVKIYFFFKIFFTAN